MTNRSDEKACRSWRDTLSVYFQIPILWVFLLGIASGFPLLLTASTLAARLTESGVNIATIGLFALIGLPYTLKFLVAPVVDSVRITRKKSHLAHRKSWSLLTQILLVSALCSMALCDPAQDTAALAVCALLTACFSAMQDIVIDALRIEILPPDAQGAGAAAAVAGYRAGMLLAGAGALILAVYLPWNAVYFIAAAVMACATAVTLSVRRLCNDIPDEDDNPDGGSAVENSKNFKSRQKTNAKTPKATQNISIFAKLCASISKAVIAPLKDFWTRPAPLTTLFFIATFKLSDAMAGTLSVPFYLMLGFSKVDIAAVTKAVGVAAVLVGTFIGGFIVKRRPMFQCLVLAGILQIASNFVFVWLAFVGNNVAALTVCILAENITGGMGTAAFVAFMAQLCNIRFTATQYALLSSLSSIGRTFIASSAGFLVDCFGWATFYVISAIMGIPGMFFLLRMYQSRGKTSPPAS